jgi:dihydrofolate reductase
MSAPLLSVIAAMAKNRVIGIENRLPWHLPEDLRHFKTLTMGHHIVMGRKTYESIGRPLPGRVTVIVTRNPDYRADGCVTADSLDAAIEFGRAAGDPEIFFVGGAELYGQVLTRADRLYLTEIQAEFAGDAHFPALDSGWRETGRQRQTSAAGLAYDFVVYARD